MNETELKIQLSEVTGSLTQIRERRAALLSELNDLEPKEAELSGRAASLRAELKALEPRPQDVERLGQLTATLHSKLAKTPRTSPTAARVKEQLPRLDDEHLPVSDRLGIAKGLMSELSDYYQRDRAIWDKAEGRAAAQRFG